MPLLRTVVEGKLQPNYCAASSLDRINIDAIGVRDSCPGLAHLEPNMRLPAAAAAVSLRRLLRPFATRSTSAAPKLLRSLFIGLIVRVCHEGSRTNKYSPSQLGTSTVPQSPAVWTRCAVVMIFAQNILSTGTAGLSRLLAAFSRGRDHGGCPASFELGLRSASAGLA